MSNTRVTARFYAPPRHRRVRAVRRYIPIHLVTGMRRIALRQRAALSHRQSRRSTRRVSMPHAKRMLLVLAVAGLAACNDSDNPAQLRVLQASPDAPAVNVLAGETQLVGGLDYGQASAQADVDSGPVTLRVDALLPAGASSPVIGPVQLELEEDTLYTVLAVGNVAQIESLVLSQPVEPVTAGSVRLRVVHAAPGAPAVDVYLTAPDANLATSAPVGSLAFKQDLGPTEVPAGAYRVRVTAAGNPGALVFDS